jgi:hypothetical protein
MPKDLEAVAALCCGVLSNASTQPVIIFIDAINQVNYFGHSTLINSIPIAIDTIYLNYSIH